MAGLSDHLPSPLVLRFRLLIATGAAVLASAAPASAALDEGGTTPVARPGTPAAATRALSASELRSELADAMADAGGASGAFVFDVDANGDGDLYGNDAEQRRVPASNEKLFTTAAFLDALGPKAHLHTRVYLKGKLGGADQSVVEGDLVIVGDGDPAFGTKKFAREADQPVTRVADLATAIAAKGIKRISGRILADDSIFDRKRAAGPDLSPLSGLSFNDGYDADGSYASAPELNAAEALKNALRKRGVEVGGRVGHANLPDSTLERNPIAEVASPPVATLIEETNVPSNNFFAETLLKRLAADEDSRGTRLAGAADVERFAESVGTSIQAVDGSGLSRRNSVSPKEVGKLLVAMARDKVNGPAFRASLPIAGREGTVADRMRGTAAEGNCATKTGTLDGVSALSGYCDAGGHTIAFSVLNNSVDINAAHSAQDRIAAAIARYRP
jgi:D-alanyl-D-alanine carboxypeptidase/D-alanyl-D-alanine-endopeptidase (penicillin-binding protein 4)